MKAPRDYVYTVYPKTGGSRGFKVETGDRYGGTWRTINGLVETPQGFVHALSGYYQGNGKRGTGYKYSMLEIVKDGKNHTRRFDQAYTVRGLTTKAKQFATDVFKTPHPDQVGFRGYEPARLVPGQEF